MWRGSVVLVVAVASCRFEPGAYTGDAGGDDAEAPNDSADGSVDAAMLGPWQTPVLMFAGAGDDDPTLTGDLLELYFNRSSDIYVVKRTTPTSPWGTPMKVNELSSGSNETTPEITGDGLTIFVGSDRSGTTGGGDVWVSMRSDRAATWSMPGDVPELSSTDTDSASAPTDDALAIVLISTRPNGLGMADIYYSVRAQRGDAWGTPADLGSVNSASNDYSPMLSQDRKALYFDSPRSGNGQLYVATRPSTDVPFGAPALIDELNTAGDESDIWVSADQRHMAFCRDGQLYETSR